MREYGFQNRKLHFSLTVSGFFIANIVTGMV